MLIPSQSFLWAFILSIRLGALSVIIATMLLHELKTTYTLIILGHLQYRQCLPYLHIGENDCSS